jgi:hypothetical protein
MSSRGADFSDILPKNNFGRLNLGFTQLTSGTDLDAQTIQQVTPNNSFRLGQQVYFWLGLWNEIATIEGVDDSENWVTRARIKLWWARPASEFRQPGGGNGQPGAAGWLPIDTQVFGGTQLLDNRYVWTPSPKRLDVTEYDTAPPDLPPPRNSDSVLLDDCWTVDLYDPSDPLIVARFPPPQVVSRWLPILYPAFGYALGFTAQLEFDREPFPDQVATPILRYSLQWSQGTFGGGARISESIG